ncbi:uncharacterized protein LOC114375793 [Glycine soja]|uniref:uncharacterized protein LOC114375793 n=1 Tax=Glycine soja TaxID=3848 RepID=UPI00103F32ED|nr:uncharacterized protein LOC114375793 [Glycine soja]
MTQDCVVVGVEIRLGKECIQMFIWISGSIKLHVSLSSLSVRATSAVLFCIMARSPNKIKNIDGSKETLKLAVRITDLWFIGTPNKSEQAEMVFVDSDGDEIHVVCKQDQLKSWKMDLKENCTYVMHNFKVLKNNGQYRVCDHQFKLVFIGVTVVRKCVLDDLPFRKYRFAGFANVVASQFEPGLLVDVIGVVEEVVFRHVSGKGRRPAIAILHFVGQLLLAFLKFLDDHEGHSPITVLLTHGRIKEVQGSYPPSVNNSFKASKLVINQPVMEIQEFNERFAKLGIEAWSFFKSHGEGSSQLSGSIQLSSKESFFGKAEAKTIVEINTISELAFSAIKKVMQRWRPSHVHVANIIRKLYRIEVMINHRDESTKFLLWDRECTELIGQSADAVNRLKIEDGDVDLNASPEALDKLLGYVLAFKIKVQPKFRNSVVLKCSTDSSLINVVMDILVDVEQSMSVTADHDPLLGLPLTPTKRQTFQDCDDEAESSQILPAQLSSNKLKKHDAI